MIGNMTVTNGRPQIRRGKDREGVGADGEILEYNCLSTVCCACEKKKREYALRSCTITHPGCTFDTEFEGMSWSKSLTWTSVITREIKGKDITR